MLNALFFVKSILLGLGLAVDSFVVAMANGMTERRSRARVVLTAVMLGVFQLAAVMIGWAIAHVAYTYFGWIKTALSVIVAVVFLFFGIRAFTFKKDDKSERKSSLVKTGVGALLVQCLATSADALTVGLTIEEYGVTAALVCAGVIAIVTFLIYILGHKAGKRFGMRYERAADTVGGIAFLLIAVEIIVTTFI